MSVTVRHSEGTDTYPESAEWETEDGWLRVHGGPDGPHGLYGPGLWLNVVRIGRVTP